MSSSGPYQIVSSIMAHDGPVRCATIGPNGELVTGSQSDSPNFRRWQETADGWEKIGESVFHDHWVTAITSLPPDISREFYSDVRYDLFYCLSLTSTWLGSS